MFSYNKKKQLRNRVIATAAGVAVMTFGIWLNYTDNDKKEVEEAVQKIEIQEETTAPSYLSEEEDIEQETVENSEKETDTNVADKSYLVKEVDGVVKVYLCDENNNEELYLITSIPFDLLSESDQQMFIDGVVIDTDDDLGKFLENFDS